MTIDPYLQDLFAQFMALGGIGALLALLINVGKAFGIVKDGDAPKWSAGLNLAGVAALFILRIVKPGFDLAPADSAVGAFVAAISPLVGWIISTITSKATHAKLAGVPLVGTSFTQRYEEVVKAAVRDNTLAQVQAYRAAQVAQQQEKKAE